MYRVGQLVSKKINRNLLNHLFQNNLRNKWSRTLFSPTTLNLVSFEESRKNVSKVIGNADNFKRQLEKNFEQEPEYLIFVDDFKNLIRVCEKDEDLDLLRKVLTRYNEQMKRLSFGRYSFGPEIMRLLYVLNKPLVGLDLINNEEFDDIFFSYKTYFLLMDLLLENKMYNEVKNCFEKYVEKQIEGNIYSSNLFILYCASMYKINTKEALENGLGFFKRFSKELIPYRCYWLLAKLAINQEEYFLASEILSALQYSSMSSNLNAVVFSKTKRYKDALFILKDFFFNLNNPQRGEKFITSDVMNTLEEEFAKCDDSTICGNFEKFKKEIVAHKLLSKKTIEDFLFEVIDYKPKPKFSRAAYN